MADARTRSAQAALMATADDTEQAFYEALQQGDVDRLMSVWAEDEEVACVHPNGPRLVGPGAIRAGFETVLSNGGMAITPVSTRRMETATCAVHHVLEKVQAITSEGLQTAYVLATNVFVRSELGWRMVAHHASPASEDALPEIVEAPTVLH